MRKSIQILTVLAVPFVLGLPASPAHAQEARQLSSPPGAAAADTLPEVDVVAHLDASRNQILPNLGATSYDIPKVQIQLQSQGENASFNQVPSEGAGRG